MAQMWSHTPTETSFQGRWFGIWICVRRFFVLDASAAIRMRGYAAVLPVSATAADVSSAYAKMLPGAMAAESLLAFIKRMIGMCRDEPLGMCCISMGSSDLRFGKNLPDRKKSPKRVPEGFRSAWACELISPRKLRRRRARGIRSAGCWNCHRGCPWTIWSAHSL